MDAPHDFLSPEDPRTLDALVCDYFPKTSFWLAVDANDHPLAFMLIENGHMAVLFF